MKIYVYYNKLYSIYFIFRRRTFFEKFITAQDAAVIFFLFYRNLSILSCRKSNFKIQIRNIIKVEKNEYVEVERNFIKDFFFYRKIELQKFFSFKVQYTAG